MSERTGPPATTGAVTDARAGAASDGHAERVVDRDGLAGRHRLAGRARLVGPAGVLVPMVAAAAGGAVEIVSMRRRHLRSVIRIEVQSYPRPWSLGLYLSELALGSLRCYLVARRAGEVVGYGGVMYIGPDAHVTTLAVAPEFHRQGIGGRVLLHLARAAVAHGAENLTLEVRVTNEAAIELYRRFGFAPAGVRKNYYAEVNEDALVMWANDIDTPEYAERLDRLAGELLAPTTGSPGAGETSPGGRTSPGGGTVPIASTIPGGDNRSGGDHRDPLS